MSAITPTTWFLDFFFLNIGSNQNLCQLLSFRTLVFLKQLAHLFCAMPLSLDLSNYFLRIILSPNIFWQEYYIGDIGLITRYQIGRHVTQFYCYW